MLFTEFMGFNTFCDVLLYCICFRCLQGIYAVLTSSLICFFGRSSMPQFAYPSLSCVHVFLISLGLYTELSAVEPPCTTDITWQFFAVARIGFFSKEEIKSHSFFSLASACLWQSSIVYSVPFVNKVLCMLADAARVQQDTDTPGISHQAYSPRGTALPKVGQRKQEVAGKNRRWLLWIKREE